MRKRHNLYLHTTILRGRRLRDGEEAGGGAGGGDNTPVAGGNAGGDSGNPGGNGDNTGEKFDPSTFWDSPTPTPTPAPSGESAGGSSPGSGTGDSQPTFAQQLTGQLQNMTFGDPVFTTEIAEEMSQGNFANVEKRIQTQMRTAVQSALAMQVQVLRPFAEQLMTQMRQEFGSTLSERDDQSALVRDFPSASNPVVRPIIQGIYDQALVRTNGNRELAVKQTKQMLAHMASQTAGDLQLDVAPQGAGDSRPSQPAINWLDELTGR